MTFTVSDDIQCLLEAQLATGRYASAEDVLLDALTVLTEHQATLDDLTASLADIEAGRVQSLEKVAQSIRDQHGWSAS